MAERPGTGELRALLLACAVLISTGGQAQTEDSLAVYRKIQSFADKRRFTQWLHDAVFVRVPDSVVAVPKADKPKRDPHRRYKGRRIRHVLVHVLDPFGSNIGDTLVYGMSALEHAGNAVHRRTRSRIIHDLLLFNEGERLDPLRLTETERVLRQYPLVNDASITVLPVKGSDSEVDVQVIVQDRWSIEGGLSGDQRSAQAHITESNLLGLGQQLEQGFAHDLSRTSPVWTGQHRVYTYGKSFVNSTARYRASQERDEAALSFSRPFFSPLTRWAGSLSGTKTWHKPSVDPLLTFDRPGVVGTTSFDAWAGLSLRSALDSSDAARSTHYVLAARYNWTDNRVPALIADTFSYADTRMALASFQVSLRQYATERYLYRFGSTEDVAEGLLLNVTAGALWAREAVLRPYTGIMATRAKYTDQGRYYLATLGLGTFWRNGALFDARALATVSGFSELFSLGRWKVRQFAQCAYAKAIAPVNSRSLQLTGDQLVRMDPYGWYGDQKLFVRMETVAYAPYNVLGFRFAPVLVLAVGTLGGEHESLDRTVYRPAFGLGLLVRNERLLSSTFRVSFAIYPGLPPEMGDFFRYNAVGSLNVRSPDIAPGAPSVIGLP
jgi:hypothetical protein